MKGPLDFGRGEAERTLDFSVAEYQARMAKARKLMDEKGLDFLFLTQAENIIYFTGYRTILFSSKFRPFLAVVPKDSDPVLILPLLEGGVGAKVSWYDDIRLWGGLPGLAGEDPLAVAVDVIKEKGLAKAKAGVEMSTGQRLAMTYEQFSDLRSKLPDLEFVDCAPVIWGTRIIKSQKEIEYLREAGRITSVACNAAVEASREGVSELEIQKVLGATMMREGADVPGFLVIASGPERYNMINPYATTRTFKKGDMVNLDIGAIYKGYWSDMTRGYFIGQVSDEQKAFFEAALEIFQAAVAQVRPGAKVSDVDRAAEETIVRLGYKENMFHRTGHSLGLEVHELPSVAPGDETILEPGMILAVEPGIYDFRIGAFRNEDTVAVTEDGYEYLTTSSRELIVRR